MFEAAWIPGPSWRWALEKMAALQITVTRVLAVVKYALQIVSLGRLWSKWNRPERLN